MDLRKKYKQLFEGRVRSNDSLLINEALNKDLKSFASDVKRFLITQGYEDNQIKLLMISGPLANIYKTISGNENLAALALEKGDTNLHVIVNTNKIKVLEKMKDKFNLDVEQSQKATGGWDDEDRGTTSNKGDLSLASDKPIINMKCATYIVRRAN
jgi:hypothetical protein